MSHKPSATRERSLTRSGSRETQRKTESAAASVNSVLQLAVLTCFLVSGVTALTYEVVWVRMLTLIFGATTLSVGTVLATYMAGLAVGSWFWCRRGDTHPNPLRLYGWLEAGIALAALISPLLFALVQRIYSGLFSEGVSDFEVLSVVRFFLCLPALFLPTFLMGGTLPVLARFYTNSLSAIGRGTGNLYALNTFGAVVGTLLSGFVLLPLLGVHGTLYAAVSVNLAVATLAVKLSRQAPPPAVIADEIAGAHKSMVLPEVPTRVIYLVVGGFAFSGASAMILEVTWTRALVQIFGNSTYAFTTMLACFLLGLAVGAAVAGRFIDRSPHPVWVFALLQGVVGTWAAVATPLVEWLPDVFLRTFSGLGGAQATASHLFLGLQAAQFLICCALMLPATLALGAIFPTVSRIYSARARGISSGVGFPYAINTVGTVIGAVAGGFVLLPRIGIEMSVLVAAALNLLVCAGAASAARPLPLRPAMNGALAFVALIAVARLGLFRFDPGVISSGVYMYPEYFLRQNEMKQLSLRDAVGLKQVLMYREGYTSSLTVVRILPDPKLLPEKQPLYLALQANGKTDASTGDLSSQRACAHLPLLLKPDARKVMVVGLASGCTAGSVLLHPVQQVDCVEIEPAMVGAAGYFGPWNHHCLQDPRLKLHLQDARNYVLMSRRQYDVITAEPTNPWIAGVNNLFTREYFELCRARLLPGGIMCQWFPAYNFSLPEMQTALASFRSVFPNVSVWAFPRLRNDFFAIGSVQPLPLAPDALLARMRGTVQADMNSIGVPNFWLLGGSLVFSPEVTTSFTRGAALNTDDHPLLEYSTPRHLYERESKVAAIEAAYRAAHGTVLPLSANQTQQWWRSLQAPNLPPDATLTLRPHHPVTLAPGAEFVDLAEAEVRLKNGAVWHLLPPADAYWPESMRAVWGSSGGRRQSLPGGQARMVQIRS